MKTYQIQKSKSNKITLLRHVLMPKEQYLKEASVAIVFAEVIVPEDLKVKRKSKERDEQGRAMHFEFKNTPFRVKYRLVGGYDPQTGIDVAGNPCNEKKESANGAAADDEKEEWLNHARSERETLRETENGTVLLQAYDTFTDAYNAAFKVQTFCNDWATDITKQMAADTHKALNSNDTVAVNANTYKDKTGNDVTYNKRSFHMSSQLWWALDSMKTQDGKPSPFNPSGPEHIDDDTLEDSKTAIENFMGRIYSTGNSEKNVEEMTRSDVYQAISQADKADVSATNVHEQFLEEVRYYKDRLERRKNGQLLAEEDKYGREEYVRKLMEEKALRAADGAVLYEGEFSGIIPDNDFVVDIRVKEENGEPTDILVSHISIPEFDFEVDSEQWDDEYREALEEQFREVSFVGQSLMEVLREGIGQIVRKEVAKYETIHI